MTRPSQERAGEKDPCERLFLALCALSTPEEARAFLLDLCTTREIADLSQRLEVAELLSAGRSYVDVSQATGASSTTVSRVSKCLNGEVGGYRLVLGRLGTADADAAEPAASSASGQASAASSILVRSEE